MAGQFIAKTVSQEVVNSTVQPIYLGGTDPSGSDAPISISSSKVANLATTTTIGGNPVASQNYANSLLASYTVTGSAVTSIDFTGLDINTHKSYRIEMEIYNQTATSSAFYLFINGDSTLTNYYNQLEYSDSIYTSFSRSNNPQMVGTDSGQKIRCIANVGLSSFYPMAVCDSVRDVGSAVKSLSSKISKTATVTNITQLTFTSAVANAIGVGSTIRIYRNDV